MPPVKFFENLDLDPIGLFLDGHELSKHGIGGRVGHPQGLEIICNAFFKGLLLLMGAASLGS
jgi:hypothetical protein